MSGGKGHAALHPGPQVAVVGVVQVRVLANQRLVTPDQSEAHLAAHPGQHGVGGEAGQPAVVTQQLAGHLQDHGVRRHLEIENRNVLQSK